MSQQHQDLLLKLLPEDCTTVGNQSLQQRFLEASLAAGMAATETDFLSAREALLAAGLVVKGRGRGGSTARATGDTRPDFNLAAPAITPELQDAPAPAKTKPAPAARQTKAPSQLQSAEPQVISYRHPDRRANNPEVGLVNTESDPEQPKTSWTYDPHLDPVLQFDSARANNG